MRGIWLRATGGRRRTLSAAIALLAALGLVAGVLVTVLSGPSDRDASAGPGVTRAAASSPGLPQVKARPASGGAPEISAVPLTLGRGARVLPGSAVPAVQAKVTRKTKVAPLRRTVQADLLVVAPFSLPATLTAKIKALPGIVEAERIEAVQMHVNGTETAVVGVDPSRFRSFAAKPTGAANALWQGVADGGIAVSYTMGKLDKIPLGGSVLAAGRTTLRQPGVASGTRGLGGVDAVVSDATARALGAPPGNAIVISVRTADFKADAAAVRKLLPTGAGVEQLVSLVTTGPASTGVADTGSAGDGAAMVSSSATTVPAAALATFLRVALSRQGDPYVYAATGPNAFDCSGLVQWAFRQAGIVMPRVAADQALTGPSVPASALQPGDLLFYHTDPTAPNYISHVAIYVGNGYMLQAPRTGLNVEVVPAAFGSEYAGAVRVNPAQAAAVAARFA